MPLIAIDLYRLLIMVASVGVVRPVAPLEPPYGYNLFLHPTKLVRCILCVWRETDIPARRTRRVRIARLAFVFVLAAFGQKVDRWILERPG